jgi:hypothetical protein
MTHFHQCCLFTSISLGILIFSQTITASYRVPHFFPKSSIATLLLHYWCYHKIQVRQGTSDLLGRLRSGGLWLEARPGKKFVRAASQPITQHGSVHLSSQAIQEAEMGENHDSRPAQEKKKVCKIPSQWILHTDMYV